MEVLAFLIFAYLSVDWLLSGRWWAWELAASAPWYVLAAAHIFAITYAAATQQWWLLPFGLILVPRILRISDVGLQFKQKHNSPESFVLFNWNTEYWTDFGNDKFFDIIRTQKADVYHFQEVWKKGEDRINSFRYVVPDLGRELGAEYEILQHHEFATATKFPVTYVLKPDSRAYLRVDMVIDGQTVSFYNVHIPVHLLLHHIWQPRKFFVDIKEWFSIRQKYSADLITELDANPNKKVISGDFNSTSSMRLMFPYLSRFLDAFKSIKFGFPTTVSVYGLKAWRIDYVLSQGVVPLRYQNINPEGNSDHSGQRVRLELES